jgi:hypothetical protein
MNEERIREIANQASAYAEATITQFDESYDEMPWDAALLKLRDLKFTELVVLRCAEIADTAEPFLASDLIKQHFGVEE